MLNSKFIISLSVFISFLLITYVIKNKTRVIEKQISNLNTKIFLDKKNLRGMTIVIQGKVFQV